MAPALLNLDLFIHARSERAVRVSRDGDLSSSCWLALVHLDVAMKGDKRALVTLPRWLAEQEGLASASAEAGQNDLFGAAS